MCNIEVFSLPAPTCPLYVLGENDTPGINSSAVNKVTYVYFSTLAMYDI